MSSVNSVEVVSEKWHLGRTVNIATILSASMLAVTVILSWGTQDARISSLEKQQVEINARIVEVLENQDKVDFAQDASLREFRGEMRSDVKEIQAKLDRLIERSLQAPTRTN